MQTSCQHCSQPILVDDAKVPQGAFMLRCPKCQGTMKVVGKAAGGSPPMAEVRQRPPASPESPAAPRPSPGGADQNAAPGRESQPESKGLARHDGPSAPKALVCLPEPAQATAIGGMLRRQGYAIVPADVWEERVEELYQGRYDVVVAHRDGTSNGHPNLYKLVLDLAPEVRRRIFMILLGEEFKTGSDAQAFTAQADLVCHPQDAGSIDALFRSSTAERARLYRAFLDALAEP